MSEIETLEDIEEYCRKLDCSMPPHILHEIIKIKVPGMIRTLVNRDHILAPLDLGKAMQEWDELRSALAVKGEVEP